MLPATRSFLSALSFSLRISILVSDADWAKAGAVSNKAPVRTHAISLNMMMILSRFGLRLATTKTLSLSERHAYHHSRAPGTVKSNRGRGSGRVPDPEPETQ